MILLDTNVLSAVMKDPPDRAIVSWLNRQPRSSIWITAVTVLEVEWGIKTMPLGKKRDRITRVYRSIVSELNNRVAAFDHEAAGFAADLMASTQKTGRATDIRDTMIAGIVLARNASFATRNITHFADIGATVINPWVA